MDKTNKKDEGFDFSELSRRWPSALVARNQDALDRFSGGILNAKTLANLDARGMGPRNKVRIGRKVAYPVQDLIDFLLERQEQN